ncbi:MAG: ATP-binding protein [Thermodesulfobacteriota bacterium]|jgi:two-component sensor histidine kinase
MLPISIALQSTNEGDLELTVSDDGVGIPEDFDIEQTDTMGLHLVKVLAGHQLDGKIDLNRTGGTQFNIKFKRTAYKPRI